MYPEESLLILKFNLTKVLIIVIIPIACLAEKILWQVAGTSQPRIGPVQSFTYQAVKLVKDFNVGKIFSPHILRSFDVSFRYAGF